MHNRLVVSVALIISILSSSASILAQEQRPRRAGDSNAEFLPAGSRVLPKGFVLVLRMESRLDSGASRPGDRFIARVNEAVTDTVGSLVLPSNLQVIGHVTEVAPAQMRRRSGLISITFDMLILPDGREMQIVGELTSASTRERRSLKLDEEGAVGPEGGQKKRNIVFIGGGAATGAVIGAIAGGAALGAGVGAAAGAAAILLAKGKEAVVEPGTLIGIELLRSIDLKTESRRLPYEPQQVTSPPAQPIPDKPVIASSVVSTIEPQIMKLSFVQAERIASGSIMIVATAETMGSGWRLRTEQRISDDALEVWIKGMPPEGTSSRALSHPTATATIPDPKGEIRRVIVHGATGDRTINLGSRSGM